MALHIAMYPWLALGHYASFLRIANNLAQHGHKISFFMPTKTALKLTTSHNHYPDLITFIPLTLPSVDGLPPGSETTNDTPPEAWSCLMTAMDLTKDDIDLHFARLKPDFIFYDFAHWLPDIARKHKVKTVFYLVSYIVSIAFPCTPARKIPRDKLLTTEDLMSPPPGFPTPAMVHHLHEALIVAGACSMVWGGITLQERVAISMEECDAIGVKTCKELEGKYCKFVETSFGKPVLLAGPAIPRLSSAELESCMDSWLKGFDDNSVVYCALGTEFVLDKEQFQELVLGLELTERYGLSEDLQKENNLYDMVVGRPFLAALKPPIGFTTIESALPEGLEARIKGRGIVTSNWVQQQQILDHPSVGCFITHCGSNSVSEALLSKCQLVLMPQAVEQFLHARLLSMDLKVGIEVAKTAKNGFYTRNAIHNAISMVMDADTGKEVRANHSKWKEIMQKEGLEDSYVSTFIENLRFLMGPHLTGHKL